jgi:hypothetical protein
MPDFEVLIPGSPGAINRAYKPIVAGPRCRVCGYGRPGIAKNDNVEAWQTEVAWRVKAARPSGWLPARRVVIEMFFWMGREGRDGDGPTKPLLDGIAVGLGVDDRIFLGRVMSNEVDRANPRSVIHVENVQ